MPFTRLAIASAPMLFVLLWSTGFIGARYGLPYIEPMTFLAVRMGFVVALLVLIALISQARWPNAHESGHCIVVGLLVHGVYLGGVFTAIHEGVPVGISALMPGLPPLLTSTIANHFMGETVTRQQWLPPPPPPPPRRAPPLAAALTGLCLPPRSPPGVGGPPP